MPIGYRPKLLDIVIPTCDRQALIRQCLVSLLKNRRLSDFNVIVSNNPPTGEGHISLDDFISKDLEIYIFQTEKFLPIDESMLRSLQYAQSSYVLWLGDDDQLVTGAVDEILETLEKEKPNALILNMGFKPKTSSEIISRKKLESPLTYDNPISFFNEWVFDLPFGSFVFLRDPAAIRDANQFVGTAHAYSAMLFSHLQNVFVSSSKVKILVASSALSFSTECEKSWSESRSEILLNLIPRWLTMMAQIVGDAALDARKQYIRQISRLRYLIELSEIGRLPQGTEYQSYISAWKICIFRVLLKFPKMRRVVNALLNHYSRLRESPLS